MPERVHRCPNCGATLAPSRFARAATCAYCQAVVQLEEEGVSAARFREALQRWRRGGELDPRTFLTLGSERWRLGPLLAHGEIADVHYAERVRTPTERAIVKVLRDEGDLPMLAAEWATLRGLRASKAQGAETLVHRTPEPIAHGRVEEGARAGATATVFRYAPRFDHTLEVVRAAYPAGVDPRVAVWMWRRVLEVLAFLHRSGVAHGAVLPPHLLVERGEHGLRLVGYGCAGPTGAPLRAVLDRHEALYPPAQLARPVLGAEHDLAQAARTIGFVLGADAAGRLPSSAPRPLAILVEAAARGGRTDAQTLWAEVGTVARDLFGPPSFHPLILPGSTGAARTT